MGFGLMGSNRVGLPLPLPYMEPDYLTTWNFIYSNISLNVDHLSNFDLLGLSGRPGRAATFFSYYGSVAT